MTVYFSWLFLKHGEPGVNVKGYRYYNVSSRFAKKCDIFQDLWLPEELILSFGMKEYVHLSRYPLKKGRPMSFPNIPSPAMLMCLALPTLRI